MLVAAACGTGSEAPSPGADRHSSRKPGAAGTSRPPAQQTPGPGSTSRPTRSTTRPVTIAFAGDVHFAGSLAGRLADPASAMGPLAGTLARADLAIVNLETAVTQRGAPQPKQYTFRAPPAAFTALADAGIDVATMANNHGLDYGPVSVPDALAAARAAGLPVIGIGQDAAAAFRPWIAEVKGQRIAFLAATAVLDDQLRSSWSAGPDRPGLATAFDGDNAALVAAVEAVRPQVDTVVVDMHYGSDLQTCPTAIQRGVVEDVVRAGADIVVGQHAHVLLGGGYDGSAYVHYGLGNFQFYSSHGPTAQTGVLELTVRGRQVSDPRWTPGRLEAGLPVPLSGSQAASARDRWASLRSCAGLSAEPAPAA